MAQKKKGRKKRKKAVASVDASSNASKLFPQKVLAAVLNYFDQTEPPLWLVDPSFKAKSKQQATPLVQATIFTSVWYLSNGYRFPSFAQAIAFTLFAAYGILCYRWRKAVRKKYGTAFTQSYFGVPEAYLNLHPLLCTVLIVVLNGWGEIRVLSADPSRAFATLFIGAYCVTNQTSLGPHTLFYDWFHQSGLDIAKWRGMGARGYSLFGVFPRAWIPRLSTNGLLWLSLMLTWNFYAAWFDGPSPPALHFLIAFFMVLLRHSQLFAENNAGMHKPVLLPAVCWYLACSPQLWSSNGFEAEGPLWPMSFLKVHIMSLYFASGIGKMVVTWRQKKWIWADGTNMQYYLFVAGFARPGHDCEALPRIGWLVKRPWACVLLGMGGLAFELFAPVALWGGMWGVLLFVVAFQFHYGIFFLQGIDFTTQWVPCLFVFLTDQRPVTLFPVSGWDAPTRELVCWAFGALFLCGQLFCASTLREVTAANDDAGGMPFSCMHMFTVNSNIFGGDCPSWYTLMSGDQRSSGHFGLMEWSGPIFETFHMSKEDMMKLPFKVVWFGHTRNAHKFLDAVVKKEYRNKRFLVFSNFTMGKKLEEKLRKLCRMVDPETDENLANNVSTLEKLVKLQGEVCNAFFKDTVRSAKPENHVVEAIFFDMVNTDSDSSSSEDEEEEEEGEASAKDLANNHEGPLCRRCQRPFRGEGVWSTVDEDTPSAKSSAAPSSIVSRRN